MKTSGTSGSCYVIQGHWVVGWFSMATISKTIDPNRLQKRLVSFFWRNSVFYVFFLYAPKTRLRIQTFCIYFHLDSWKSERTTWASLVLHPLNYFEKHFFGGEKKHQKIRWIFKRLLFFFAKKHTVARRFF